MSILIKESLGKYSSNTAPPQYKGTPHLNIVSVNWVPKKGFIVFWLSNVKQYLYGSNPLDLSLSNKDLLAQLIDPYRSKILEWVSINLVKKLCLNLWP